MPEAYRVVIIMPQGYIHSSCFLETAILIKASCDSLGIDCDVKLNEMSKDRINIILGGHLITYADSLKAYRYIPYQLEQLSSNEGAWSQNLQSILGNAYEVWDYSIENISFLKGRGIAARHLPVGYHPALERIPRSQPEDIDVLFYGSVGGRRKSILDTLAATPGIAFKLLFGAYGEQRDAVIGRSKIILNIHYYPVKIFEAVRISYLINNRCFVLSEESPINPYPGVDVCMTSYERILDRIQYYLSAPAERDRIRQSVYQQFKQLYPMPALLAKII
jgi:hypothetical protein